MKNISPLSGPFQRKKISILKDFYLSRNRKDRSEKSGCVLAKILLCDSYDSRTQLLIKASPVVRRSSFF